MSWKYIGPDFEEDVDKGMLTEKEMPLEEKSRGIYVASWAQVNAKPVQYQFSKEAQPVWRQRTYREGKDRIDESHGVCSAVYESVSPQYDI